MPPRGAGHSWLPGWGQVGGGGRGPRGFGSCSFPSTEGWFPRWQHSDSPGAVPSSAPASPDLDSGDNGHCVGCGERHLVCLKFTCSWSILCTPSPVTQRSPRESHRLRLHAAPLPRASVIAGHGQWAE